MPSTARSTGDNDAAAERPSKTRLKKESRELQTLGAELAELPEDRLAALPVEESLIEAVREYKRTRSHEGRRRQLQYIGKLMRHADPAPLREAVASLKVPHAEETLALHRAEHWRTEIIADDEALTRWVAEHPDADVQKLRSLVRAARKEGQLPPEQRHGRAYRELFQIIRKST
ncbi:MAG TPA: ribosome biogenesis factor YjgA [Burkholderiaceae bacterium]|nr:ribosome biogenesis factor YjgA [Burkholderiaceae bacterium]